MGNETRKTTRIKEETQGRNGKCFKDLAWKERVPLFDNKSGSACGIHGQENESVRHSVRISRDAEDMLVKAKRKPYLTMTALYSEVGLSSYKGLKCKQELIRVGLADEVELPTNRRGRRGVKHIYYQRILRDWYQAHGYTAEIESTIGDTCLDVLVIRKDGARLGIEIALSEQYEATNAQKAMEAGLEHLMFVCETEELLERLRKRLSPLIESRPSSKPGFKLIGDYLREDCCD